MAAALAVPLTACSLALDTTGFAGRADASADASAGAGAEAFCVDATEVTNADYARFLAGGSEPRRDTDAPAACADKGSYEPAAGWPAAGRDAFPVVHVDWCDARAYCSWAGKRLCGRRGGGVLAPSDAADARASQWFAACSRDGASRFPYGDSYDLFACNGPDRPRPGPPGTSAAGSLAACAAASGALDMSGNVHEWEDACDGEACLARGGAFRRVQLVDIGGASVACAATLSLPRLAARDDLGFRCCSP